MFKLSLFPGKSRAFSCTLCPKAFYKSQHLQDHVNIFHMGVKPYQCLHCNQKYSSSSSLKSHQINVHNIGKQIMYDLLKNVSTILHLRRRKTKLRFLQKVFPQSRSFKQARNAAASARSEKNLLQLRRMLSSEKQSRAAQDHLLQKGPQRHQLQHL